MASMGFSGIENEASCKVILIGGFLGAGKTTLLRHILQWPGDLSKTALLINEFGRVGIDGEVLQGFQTPVMELTNGCICCTLQNDMHRAVAEILDSYQPERILIEATGVADPLDISKFLCDSPLSQRLSEMSVITVLDADLWEGREYFGPLFYNQIRAADLLLFNKVDLLQEDRIPGFLEEAREFNPNCGIIPTHHCRIDPEVLWTLGKNSVSNFHFSRLSDSPSTTEALGFVAFSFEAEHSFEDGCFRQFVHDLPLKLYRLKGSALLDGKQFFINHVGGKTEWQETGQNGSTRLAFVGWQVNPEEIRKTLNSCLKI
jgi:G3E family GTPase